MIFVWNLKNQRLFKVWKGEKFFKNRKFKNWFRACNGVVLFVMKFYVGQLFYWELWQDCIYNAGVSNKMQYLPSFKNVNCNLHNQEYICS